MQYSKSCIESRNFHKYINMIIRNFEEDDLRKYGISCDIPWADVEKKQSFIMFNDDGKVECYILLEKAGKFPKGLYEEDTRSYRIVDMFIADKNPIPGHGLINFKRLFWVMLTCDNGFSVYWIDKNHKNADIWDYRWSRHVEQVGDSLVYYKSLPYLTY